jgi:hypothetical protein
MTVRLIIRNFRFGLKNSKMTDLSPWLPTFGAVSL